jgi:hypothetical protein
MKWTVTYSDLGKTDGDRRFHKIVVDDEFTAKMICAAHDGTMRPSTPDDGILSAFFRLRAATTDDNDGE